MIILINGTMNAGKSTIARLLTAELPRTAHIEKLRQFIEWMSIQESIPYNIQNIIALTKNFVSMGDLNVVISYPVSSENYKIINEELKDLGKPIHAFTLAPRLDVVTKDRGLRELKPWQIAEITKNYQDNFHKPDFGIIIDNSDQTPEQTLDEILKYLDVR